MRLFICLRAASACAAAAAWLGPCPSCAVAAAALRLDMQWRGQSWEEGLQLRCAKSLGRGADLPITQCLMLAPVGGQATEHTCALALYQRKAFFFWLPGALSGKRMNSITCNSAPQVSLPSSKLPL